MTRPLDVLLIESHEGDGNSDAEFLEAAGHRVHRCWEKSDHRHRGGHMDRSLCVGVTHRTCPLEQGIDVALLVRGRIEGRPTPNEAGASCALRANVPLVEDGPTLLDPFEPWLTARTGIDVVATCEETAAHGFDGLRTEIEIRTRHLLVGAGIDPSQVDTVIAFDHPHLFVRLYGPAVSSAVQHSLGVRVLDAVRLSERTFDRVDVSYEPAINQGDLS